MTVRTATITGQFPVEVARALRWLFQVIERDDTYGVLAGYEVLTKEWGAGQTSREDAHSLTSFQFGGRAYALVKLIHHPFFGWHPEWIKLWDVRYQQPEDEPNLMIVWQPGAEGVFGRNLVQADRSSHLLEISL